MPSRTIDWKAIHKRLDMAAAAISEGFDPGPTEIRRSSRYPCERGSPAGTQA